MPETLLPEKDAHLGRVLTAIKLNVEELNATVVRMELENDCKLRPDKHHCFNMFSIIKQLHEQYDFLENLVGAYYDSSEEEE